MQSVLKEKSVHGAESVLLESEKKVSSDFSFIPVKPALKIYCGEPRKQQSTMNPHRLSIHSIDFNSEADSVYRRSPTNRSGMANRFALDLGKRDLSKFQPKDKQSLAHQLNNRRNMLNWVQPEIILARCFVKLNQHVQDHLEAAFKCIREAQLSSREKSVKSSLCEISTVSTVSRKYEKKSVMSMYFCLDLVAKRWIRDIFFLVKDFRNQKALETFEFQVTCFNKFTQTYRHHFNPSSMNLQKDDPGCEELRVHRLSVFLDRIEHKRNLFLKGAFLALIISAENNQITTVHQQLQEILRKINRKLEWRSINERNKRDAEKKFCLSFLVNLVERKTLELLEDSFATIERSGHLTQLKRIAIANLSSLRLRVVSKEFHRFRLGCFAKKPELRYEQVDQLKGLVILNKALYLPIAKVLKQTMAKIRLELRFKSRRSVVGGAGRLSIIVKDLGNKRKQI